MSICYDQAMIVWGCLVCGAVATDLSQFVGKSPDKMALFVLFSFSLAPPVSSSPVAPSGVYRWPKTNLSAGPDRLTFRTMKHLVSRAKTPIALLSPACKRLKRRSNMDTWQRPIREIFRAHFSIRLRHALITLCRQVTIKSSVSRWK